MTIAVAESCTGGLLGAVLTATAGSSTYVRGGIIAYANDVKADQLGVGRHLLVTHGAVSAEVAMAMAQGASERFKATIGVGITGVAGPDASEQKPAGLVLVAVAGLGSGQVVRLSKEISAARPNRAKCGARRAAVVCLEVRWTGGWRRRAGPSSTVPRTDCRASDRRVDHRSWRSKLRACQVRPNAVPSTNVRPTGRARTAARRGAPLAFSAASPTISDHPWSTALTNTLTASRSIEPTVEVSGRRSRAPPRREECAGGD